ncbi:MAG: sugar phosphate isomerase/epimerase family protein [Elusimicrobiota bacterium]
MKIGAVNNFRNDISDEIRLVASESFGFIDLTLEPVSDKSLDTADVKKALEDTGIEIIGHTSVFLPVVFPLESVRCAAMDEMTRYVDFFSDIGARCMSVHPSGSIPIIDHNELIKANREFISAMAGMCKRKKMTLMLETVMTPFNTPEIFRVLLEGMDEVMVHLDVGHCNVNSQRDLAEEFFDEFGERIRHIHFSDNCGENDDHLPLGKGSVDWRAVMKILSRYGYDGTITLEIFSEDRRLLLESKKYLEDIIAGERQL